MEKLKRLLLKVTIAILKQKPEPVYE